MNYNRKIEELQTKAILWWPEELYSDLHAYYDQENCYCVFAISKEDADKIEYTLKGLENVFEDIRDYYGMKGCDMPQSDIDSKVAFLSIHDDTPL